MGSSPLRPMGGVGGAPGLPGSVGPSRRWHRTLTKLVNFNRVASLTWVAMAPALVPLCPGSWTLMWGGCKQGVDAWAVYGSAQSVHHLHAIKHPICHAHFMSSAAGAAWARPAVAGMACSRAAWRAVEQGQRLAAGQAAGRGCRARGRAVWPLRYGMCCSSCQQMAGTRIAAPLGPLLPRGPQVVEQVPQLHKGSSSSWVLASRRPSSLAVTQQRHSRHGRLTARTRAASQGASSLLQRQRPLWLRWQRRCRRTQCCRPQAQASAGLVGGL